MTPYRFLYRFGITPWDGDEVPEPLRDLVGRRDGAAGRALDIGCGTGRDAVFLAERGWSVTGVDNVQQPLDAARERARSADVNVTWVDGELWHATLEGDESELRHIDPHTGEVFEQLQMPPGAGVSGLESDGADRFFCGGSSSGTVRVVRRPKRATKGDRKRGTRRPG